MELIILLALSAGPHPLTDPLPGPDSPSTAWVLEKLKSLRPSAEPASADAGSPIALECLQTPGQPDTVGVRQDMLIDAPLADVAAVVEDFAHYAELFPDVKDVHRVAGQDDENRFVVAWEQKVPVFFWPNVKYEMAWVVERARPGRVSYLYKLKQKGEVYATDGFIALEAVGTQTRYSEVDFIDAATGPVPNATVWDLTLSGMFRSDVAIKLKAEHPAWSYPKLRAEAEKLLERFPTRVCFDKRHPR